MSLTSPVAPTPAKAGWLNREENRVQSFRDLPQNWDGEGADAPNETAQALAIDALHHAHDLEMRPDDIGPSAENGISFAWKRGDLYADLEFFNDGEIVVGMLDKNQKPVVKSLSAAAIRETLSEIRNFLWEA